MKPILQHYCNVLHVYCRLCYFLPCGEAKRLARAWEQTRMYKVIYA